MQMTGSGFVVNYKLDRDAIPLEGETSFRLGDVNGNAAGVPDGLGFVLFVRNGLISSLEGYVYAGGWPVKFEKLRLNYNSEPRKLSMLV